MRYVYLFFMLMLVSCKSTKTSVNQELTQSVSELIEVVDSIHQINESLVEEIEKNRKQQNTRLFLTPVLDSNGVVQPISYSELRHGVVTRQIELTGASLEEITEDIEETEKQTIKKDSTATSGTSNLNYSGNTDTNISTKIETESEITGGGFWARFKLWLIIALLLVLLFLSWRLKLF